MRTAFRAVEMACDFGKRNDVLGAVYKNIKNKALLHLSLLLHDLGKGFTEDHSDVGKVIADDTAKLLKLSDSDREMLVFLVYKHLLMTHMAFRYDLSQKDTIVQFASQVGSVEALQMLYVLSCADLAAVGPGALNDWKLDLLTQLYQRTDSQFRDEKPDEWFQKELEAKRDAVRRLVVNMENSEWWFDQIQGTPANYLFRCTPSQIVQELESLRSLNDANPATAWARHYEDRDAVEYTVGMRDVGKRLGIFHRITGALSSQGLQILEAEVHTQPDGTAWDRFLVSDLDYEGAPPPIAFKPYAKRSWQPSIPIINSSEFSSTVASQVGQSYRCPQSANSSTVRQQYVGRIHDHLGLRIRSSRSPLFHCQSLVRTRPRPTSGQDQYPLRPSGRRLLRDQSRRSQDPRANKTLHATSTFAASHRRRVNHVLERTVSIGPYQPTHSP